MVSTAIQTSNSTKTPNFLYIKTVRAWIQSLRKRYNYSIYGLIENVRKNVDILSEDEEDIINSSMEVIREEINSLVPRKGFIKTALSGLNSIKGTMGFMAAIATSIQFINTLL